MTALLLIAVLFITAILVAMTVVSLLAWSILHPPRMTDGKAAWVLKRVSPGDLEMKYQEVEFPVRDQRRGESLKIRAWWIPSPTAESDRCVVMVHGYADAKVGAIAWAPTWQALGYHILAVDLRAHGESGGTLCTGGYFERDDLRQVIHQLRARYPSETAGGVLLFGVSLGTLVAAAVAGDGGIASDVEKPEILALVLDSPILSFRDGITQHIRLLGVAGPWTIAAALKLAEKVSEADFAALQLSKLLPTVSAPVMIIFGEADRFAPSESRDVLKSALDARGNGRDVVQIVPGAAHLMPLVADPAEYAAAIERFLDSHPGV